jgi:hypothetical protein
MGQSDEADQVASADNQRRPFGPEHGAAIDQADGGLREFGNALAIEPAPDGDWL